MGSIGAIEGTSDIEPAPDGQTRPEHPAPAPGRSAIPPIFWARKIGCGEPTAPAKANADVPPGRLQRALRAHRAPPLSPLAPIGTSTLRSDVQVAAQVLRIADVDREAVAPFDGGADRRAADGALDDALDVADPQAVARQLVGLGDDVQVEAAQVALVEDAARPLDGRHQVLERDADPLHLVEVGAEDLDPDRRAHAGGQHVDARLDRHGPGVGPARELHLPVHLRRQLVPGQRLLLGPERAEARASASRAPSPSTSGRGASCATRSAGAAARSSPPS